LKGSVRTILRDPNIAEILLKEEAPPRLQKEELPTEPVSPLPPPKEPFQGPPLENEAAMILYNLSREKPPGVEDPPYLQKYLSGSIPNFPGAFCFPGFFYF